MSAELIPIPQPAEPADEEPQEPQHPVLSIAQQRGLLALLAHPNIRQAARSIGIHERTLRRWLATPTFRDALNASLECAQDELRDNLEQGALDAVEALRVIARSEYSSDLGRIAASKHLLEFCERRTLRHDLAALLRRP